MRHLRGARKQVRWRATADESRQRNATERFQSADDCKGNYTDKDLSCTVRNAALRVCPASGSREGATATRGGRVGHGDWVRPILLATQHARCRGLKAQGPAGARRAVAAAATGSARAARCLSVARGGSAGADAATCGRKAPPPSPTHPPTLRPSATHCALAPTMPASVNSPK